MSENCPTKLYNWLHENLEEGHPNDYVDLLEIKRKLSVEVTSRSIGNFIKKMFIHVNVKNGRSKVDWCKMTKCYYGLKWKQICSTIVDLGSLVSQIPNDFIMLSRNMQCVTIGYFRNIVINGMRVLTEAILNVDHTWSLTVMGRKIDPTTLDIDNTFKVPVIFQIIRQLTYCNGANKIDDSKKDKDFFKERISPVGDENAEVISFRSKKCLKVLPMICSNKALSSCNFCKHLEKPVQDSQLNIVNNIEQISNDVTTCTNTEQDLLLNKTDNDDMSQILDKIFPECNEKMKTFLLSQKWPMRVPKGRRWDRDIVRLCLTLWCRSAKGYTDLRNSKFLILPSEKLLQRYKNHVNQEAGINSDILHWMANEAKLKNLPPEGFEGGLIIDEMSIQPDLQFKKTNGEIELIGFTEVLPESLVFDEIKTNRRERILATHVLQLVFF